MLQNAPSSSSFIVASESFSVHLIIRKSSPSRLGFRTRKSSLFLPSLCPLQSSVYFRTRKSSSSPLPRPPVVGRSPSPPDISTSRNHCQQWTIRLRARAGRYSIASQDGLATRAGAAGPRLLGRPREIWYEQRAALLYLHSIVPFIPQADGWQMTTPEEVSSPANN